jgi:hypothetical protein
MGARDRRRNSCPVAHFAPASASHLTAPSSLHFREHFLQTPRPSQTSAGTLAWFPDGTTLGRRPAGGKCARRNVNMRSEDRLCQKKCAIAREQPLRSPTDSRHRGGETSGKQLRSCQRPAAQLQPGNGERGSRAAGHNRQIGPRAVAHMFACGGALFWGTLRAVAHAVSVRPGTFSRRRIAATDRKITAWEKQRPAPNHEKHSRRQPHTNPRPPTKSA